MRKLPEGSSLNPTSTSRFPVYTRISRSADFDIGVGGAVTVGRSPLVASSTFTLQFQV